MWLAELVPSIIGKERLSVLLVASKMFGNLGRREFYANWLTETKYKTVPIRGRDVKFTANILNVSFGTLNCDVGDFTRLKEKPPLLRYTSYIIVHSVFLLAKNLSYVMWDKVVLIYMLMKGMPINVGAILRDNMMMFRNNLRMITYFLRAEGIKEEVRNKTSRYGRDKTVGIKPTKTRTKTNNKSYKAKLYFNGANGKLLQNYRTQISRSPLFKMLRRKQYNSSRQPGIGDIRQDKRQEGKENIKMGR
ncbi:hypothetical protein H5410_014795 [Solanum commersonii]|uniref:Putative plant transposon protein domain-containing protein n=1 Tax=Solanum commersonii TaxID=4109 RepID=A0A9J5ZS98_SOLCO|nr:hypothetical protein H5410_014795 [Solanum commersonii]